MAVNDPVPARVDATGKAGLLALVWSDWLSTDS